MYKHFLIKETKIYHPDHGRIKIKELEKTYPERYINELKKERSLYGPFGVNFPYLFGIFACSSLLIIFILKLTKG